MKILAIESSADETGIAICDYSHGVFVVEKNLIASQIDMHRAFGGIVPNLAGKYHTENILPLLREAAIDRSEIDLIAVTAGPGLMPCLVVGVSAANALAVAWDKPLLGVHHIEGHIYANWINPLGSSASKWVNPLFPGLALVVSGGHTQLMLMRDHGDYEIIGQTQDDAVGEAYDKAARLLGLPYPGGPEIDVRAATFKETSHSEQLKAADILPRPMFNSGDYHFSFSGLKTAVLYKVRDYQKNVLLSGGMKASDITKDAYESVDLPEEFVASMCYAFQEAACDVLIKKTLEAAREYNVQSILLTGGVSANKYLRAQLEEKVYTQMPQVSVHIPELAYCLDNGAMIAAAAAYRWERMSDLKRANLDQVVTANPNLTI